MEGIKAKLSQKQNKKYKGISYENVKGNINNIAKTISSTHDGSENFSISAKYSGLAGNGDVHRASDKIRGCLSFKKESIKF